MKTEIRPFSSEFIPDAGKLLAQRHRRNRAQLPLLPARFEDPDVAAEAVKSLWEVRHARGYAALRNGKLIAYIIGNFVIQPWARSGYVYLPGYALAEGESTFLLQDLYACLGDDWVQRGIFYHNLYISTADANIIEAFIDLAFGRELLEGLLDLSTVHIPEIEDPTGIEIRLARRNDGDDKEHIGVLSTIQVRNLSLAPYWHSTAPEDHVDMRQDYGDQLIGDGSVWTMWLAMEKETPLGMIGTRPDPEESSKMFASPRTVYLSLASTQPAARGRGIGTALAWTCLKQARDNGFEFCHINWNSPNLLAARFWPRFGFQPFAYRLAKQIAPMILWANGELE